MFACLTILQYVPQIFYLYKILFFYFFNFLIILILSMSYSSIIRELEASRRLSNDLALERQHQEYERAKIEKELESLRRSRKNYIDSQIAQSKIEYEEKLKEDVDVSEEHLNRKKRAITEKAKMAQQDFERQRQRLIEERNNHDNLDKQFRVVDKKLLDLQTRSRLAQDEENRKIFQFTNRRNTILKLIEESKQREVYHYTQSKNLATF